MKIAIVGTVASSVFGFRLPFIRLLLEEGHDVFVFSIDFNQEQKGLLVELGVTPVDYNITRSGKNPFLMFSEIKELKSKLLEVNPDVFFGYFLKPVLFGGIAAKLANIPKRIGLIEGLGQVYTIPPSGLTIRKRILMKFLSLGIGFVTRLLNSVIVLNRDDFLELSKYSPKNKIKLLGGIGVDLEEFYFRPYTHDKFVRFIFVGRLLEEKGVRQFVNAAKAIKAQYSNVEFLLVGALDDSSSSGISLEELELFKEQGIVKHHGHVNNVADYVANASVFVLPSYYREGVPRSTQEALAIGRAVITTDNTGCRDTVNNGVNGFLVSKYSTSELVEKMQKYIECPELIHQHGIMSRKLAEERFDVISINRKLLGFMYD